MKYGWFMRMRLRIGRALMRSGLAIGQKWVGDVNHEKGNSRFYYEINRGRLGWRVVEMEELEDEIRKWAKNAQLQDRICVGLIVMGDGDFKELREHDAHSVLERN